MAHKKHKRHSSSKRGGKGYRLTTTTVKRYFGGKVHVTRHYRRYRQFPPSKCAPGSFRMKRVGGGRRTTLLTICCPKGHWSRKRRRCTVGTRTQSILKRRR